MDVTMSAALTSSAVHLATPSPFPELIPSPLTSCDRLLMRTPTRHRTQSAPLSKEIPLKTIAQVLNNGISREDPSCHSPSAAKTGFKSKLTAVARSICPSRATRTSIVSSDMRPELPEGPSSVSVASRQWVGGTVAEWDVHVFSVPFRKLKLSEASPDQPPMLFPTSELCVQFPSCRSTLLHSAGTGVPSLPPKIDTSIAPPIPSYACQKPLLPPSPSHSRSGAPSISDLVRDYEPSNIEKKLDNRLSFLKSQLHLPHRDWILWNRLACQVCTKRTGIAISKRPKGLFFGPPGHPWPGVCTCEDEE